MDTCTLKRIRELFDIAGIEIRSGMCDDPELPDVFSEPVLDLAERRPKRHFCHEEHTIRILGFVVFDPVIQQLRRPARPYFERGEYNESWTPYGVDCGFIVHANMWNPDRRRFVQANAAEALAAMALYHQVLGSVRCIEDNDDMCSEDSYQVYWQPRKGLVVDSACSLLTHHRLFVPRKVLDYRPAALHIE